jgi:2-aminoadipate transaminase
MHTIAFARGVPAPEMLPVDLIRDAVDSALEHDPARILSYGTGGGYGPLREFVASVHGTKPSNIIATTGSLHAFALLVEYLRTDSVGAAPLAFVENPTYDRPLIVLRRNGYRIRAIPTDAYGMIPQELEQAIGEEQPAFLYVIPSFQNPSGATLSDERRDEILRIAATFDVPVIEDDPYGLLHFDTPAPPSLFERATDATVIYANSYSKTIAPGLRVGYIVLPDALAGKLERYANDTYISPTLLGQAAVHRILEDGAFDRHVATVRTMLASRCERMCNAIDHHLPQAIYARPGGGYFLWVELGSGVDTDALLTPAADAGVTFVQGSAFGSGHSSALRLAFSSPDIDDIAVGVERIAQAVRNMGVPAGAR